MNPTMVPTRKVTLGGAVTGLCTILVWYLNTHHNAQIPAEIGMAAAGTLTFIAQYFVPDAPKAAE